MYIHECMYDRVEYDQYNEQHHLPDLDPDPGFGVSLVLMVHGVLIC